LDNASTHKTPAIKRWLAAHPRFVLHFTPTSASWLNLVERWFAKLTTKKPQRSTDRSVRALNADVRAWIQTWNDNPQAQRVDQDRRRDPRQRRQLLPTN
jgi:transposase